MNRIVSRLAALAGVLLLGACATGPTPGSEPFRGEFPARDYDFSRWRMTRYEEIKGPEGRSYYYRRWERDFSDRHGETRHRNMEEFRHRFHDDRVQVEPYQGGMRVMLPAEVLFDLDSDVLRPEALDIIGMLADEYKESGDADIDVNGYTDTSGTMDHNDLLSQARADAVADALVKDGIDPSRVTPRGLGESVLAVPTPDGVREPRNRRVEIILIPSDNPPPEPPVGPSSGPPPRQLPGS